MGEVCRIGLDIAKEYFQVHGVDKNGKDVFNRKLKRKNVLAFFANLPPCLVGLEACGGAHYWARALSRLDAGHTVKTCFTTPCKIVCPEQQDRCGRCQGNL